MATSESRKAQTVWLKQESGRCNLMPRPGLCCTLTVTANLPALQERFHCHTCAILGSYGATPNKHTNKQTNKQTNASYRALSLRIVPCSP